MVRLVDVTPALASETSFGANIVTGAPSAPRFTESDLGLWASYLGGVGLLVGGVAPVVDGAEVLAGGVGLFAGGLSPCLVSRFS
jgi:hypothetical protein